MGKPKLIEMVGYALLAWDMVLLLVWLCASVIIAILDAATLEAEPRFAGAHTVLALHFPTTVVLCLVMETFASMMRPRDGRPKEPIKGMYLLSWIITLAASTGTDILSVAFFANKFSIPSSHLAPDLVMFELILACLFLVTSVVALAWAPIIWGASVSIAKRRSSK